MRKKRENSTQRFVLKQIRSVLGLTANVIRGEYCVNYRKHDPRYRPTPKDGAGGTSYFTNDAQDALDTAGVMSRMKAIAADSDNPEGNPAQPSPGIEVVTLEGSDLHVEKVTI